MKQDDKLGECETSRSRAVVGMAVQIVDAYVRFNRVAIADLPSAIRSIHVALTQLGGASGSETAADIKPAVSIRKSVGDDFIICLEDGKRLTMLKRYLRTHHNMSPEEYRTKWDLPHDYPMVAPAYARLRSAFAKKIGLGRVPVSGKRSRKK